MGITDRMKSRRAVAFTLLSILGVAAASYQADKVAIIVDASVYLERGGLLQQGGVFPIDPNHGFLKGLALDSLSLVRTVILCQPWDSFTPLYVLWAKQVFRHSTSWLWTVHLPPVFWFGIAPGLLGFWLYRGPLRIGFPASLFAGWFILWNPYLLGVTRLGWLQPSVMSFVILHLFAIDPLFHERSPKGRPAAFILIGGMASALLMVLQHGSSLFIALAVLSFLALSELRRRPIEVPRTAFWYLIMILPAAGHTYHFYWCIFQGAPSFAEPFGREWERLLRENGGTPFQAVGWDLLVPGLAGLILALASNRKLLVLLYVTLFHAFCTIVWTYYPHYRYFYLAFPLLAAYAGYLFQVARERMPRIAGGAIAVAVLLFFPFRAHQSLIATRPSVLTNPVAWRLSQGGAGVVSMEEMLKSLRELGRRGATVYVAHSNSGVFYAREAGADAVSANETMIKNDVPDAVIGTDYAWTARFEPWFLARYRNVAHDGRDLHLFVLTD
jgi:hypothetical protein